MTRVEQRLLKIEVNLSGFEQARDRVVIFYTRLSCTAMAAWPVGSSYIAFNITSKGYVLHPQGTLR